MRTSPRSTARQGAPQLNVRLARNEADLLAAQRLRYDIFAGEMGARLASADTGIDRDEYDPICDHLLVTAGIDGPVVGTYRMLPPARAARAPCLYAEHEFDLGALATLKPRLVEVGRSCVHPDYRRGAVIAMLWTGLVQYARSVGGDYLAGCASVPLHDGGREAASAWQHLQPQLAPPEWRVTPLLPLPLESLPAPDPAMPLAPLLKGYLRAGAYICGEPAWDPDFRCADFFVLLPLAATDARYARRFVAPAGQPRA